MPPEDAKNKSKKAAEDNKAAKGSKDADKKKSVTSKNADKKPKDAKVSSALPFPASCKSIFTPTKKFVFLWIYFG